jgi:uncharacterized protein with ATP-grasp and redox domains
MMLKNKARCPICNLEIKFNNIVQVVHSHDMQKKVMEEFKPD